MNPYSDSNFFTFFSVLFTRIGNWITGNGSPLVSDEIQLITLTLLSISTGLIGCLLVLRKSTMLANSLSHTILLGIILSYLALKAFSGGAVIGSLSLSHILLAAFITALLTTFLTEFFSKVIRLQEDASIGLIFTGLFALGIILVTLYTRNLHIGTEVIMGNVDALHADDIRSVFSITLINVFFAALFFRGFFSTTFDASFSKSQGISPGFFHYFLMLLTSMTVIGAFRAVGAFLVLSMLVGPALISRMLTYNYTKIFLISAGIGAISSVFSVALSRHFLSVYKTPFSTAGLMITLIFFGYLLVAMLRSKRVSFIR